ncbi:MAG: ferritin-like domain-containing protein [Actinomycetales bacterium]|nr:ferritin-like domain-containing protein [Actinomycetales bacterium]
MFEHFDKPDELFRYRLGVALTMERDSLEMLGELEQAARSEELKKMFSHHADETRGQIENLEQVFSLLSMNPDAQPNRVTDELAKEGKELIRKSDESILDHVTLSAALETEHAEIAAYQTLIASAEAMGEADVAKLLTENLEQEQHTSEELHAKAKEYAAKLAAA